MKVHKKPFWRKIIIVPLLPIIVIVWTIGWTLTIIGSNQKTTKILEESFSDYPEVNATQTDKEIEDDSSVRFEQEIIT